MCPYVSHPPAGADEPGADESSSMIEEAACVMVGTRVHANAKDHRRRFGSQALHWGVLFVALLLSLPIVLPTLSGSMREWIVLHVLDSPGNWKSIVLSLLASGVFSIGFVYRVGRERVQSSCAMLRRLGPATVFGVAWSIVPSFAGVMLILNMEPIRLALVGEASSSTHMMMGMLIYLVGFIVLAGFGCLPTVSQAILAGYAFGLPMGLGLALIGFGGASLVGYALVRRVVHVRVEHELERCPKVIFMRDALLRAKPIKAVLMVALLRASPSTPFALTNLLLGSIGIARGVFFFGTIIGMFPRTLAAVLIGHQITAWTGEYDKPMWALITGIIALIILVVLISRAAASALARVSQIEDTSPVFAH